MELSSIFQNYRQRARLSGDAPYLFWLYINVKDTEKRLRCGDFDMKEMLKMIMDILSNVAVLHSKKEDEVASDSLADARFRRAWRANRRGRDMIKWLIVVLSAINIFILALLVSSEL